MDRHRRATKYHREGWKIEKCADIQTDRRQEKNLGHTDGRGSMRMGRIRTKNPFFFGFPYATQTTGVIGAKELAIDFSHKPTLQPMGIIEPVYQKYNRECGAYL